MLPLLLVAEKFVGTPGDEPPPFESAEEPPPDEHPASAKRGIAVTNNSRKKGHFLFIHVQRSSPNDLSAFHVFT